MKNKRIITVATTGAWTTKKDNPNIPITPAEIAADVYESRSSSMSYSCQR